MALTIDACVAQHIGDRKEQQDRAGLYQHPKLKKIVLAALADGMGGHAGGALAAEQVTHTAKMSLEQFSPQEESAGDMLRATLNEAHMLIRSCRFLNEQDPHSTGVLLLLQPREDHFAASWAHCGDSRLYHFRGARPLAQTRDHSYVEQLVREGRVTPEQAAKHLQRNVLVTSLGGTEAPMIDCAQSTDLAAGDSLLLCSDGLWSYFDADEMGALLASSSAREAAGSLITGARERARGRGDNCSLAILKLVETAEKPAAPPARPKPR